MTKRVQTNLGPGLSNALFFRIGDQLLIETRMPLWSLMSDDGVYYLKHYLVEAIRHV